MCLYQFIICVYNFHDVTMDLDAHVRTFSSEGLNFRQGSFEPLTKFMTLCAETQKFTGRIKYQKGVITCDKKNLSLFLVGYDFYPTCVLSIPSTRIGKIQLYGIKPYTWEVLYITFSLSYWWNLELNSYSLYSKLNNFFYNSEVIFLLSISNLNVIVCLQNSKSWEFLFSSPERKAHVSFSDRMSSVCSHICPSICMSVCLSVCV